MTGDCAAAPVVVLDACVLYPTVMREILIGVASAGLFDPKWSDRILEEWARAALRRDPAQEAIARGEIAVLQARWPGAVVPCDPRSQETLYLPDANDIHVLASAIQSRAQCIVTMNLRDFPKRSLSEFKLSAVHPDAFLFEHCQNDPTPIWQVAETVRKRAEHLSAEQWPMRKLLKKAKLPRLGKALELHT